MTHLPSVQRDDSTTKVPEIVFAVVVASFLRLTTRDCREEELIFTYGSTVQSVVMWKSRQDLLVISQEKRKMI